MRNFSISLAEEEVEVEDDKVLLGRICLGEFTDSFSCSLSYWGKDAYLSQWREALGRLLDGKGSSAIVTTMYDPETANFIFWWVMYLSGQCVYVQHHVLFLDELRQRFDEHDIYKFIPEREVNTDEGELISEWVVDIDDVRDCLGSLRMV